jgi:'Cold-shock' DNA-binding domain
MQTGIVKRWNDVKGYGFITPEHGTGVAPFRWTHERLGHKRLSTGWARGASNATERAWKNRMRAVSLASSNARADGSRFAHA